MSRQTLALLLRIGLLACAAAVASGQQVADLEFQPPITAPAYPRGEGPLVLLDEAHHNFHTKDGRYAPFARLLERDGYVVQASTAAFAEATLPAGAVLVIANALHAEDLKSASTAMPSAFTPEEIVALEKWVRAGGSLFLIVDHMPIPSAAQDLAAAFGLEFSNGYAAAVPERGPDPIIFTHKNGLPPSPVRSGRKKSEVVLGVTTFTGSAFRAPESATPVLVLPKGSVSLMPTQVWHFGPDTPRIDVGGWLQGALLRHGQGRVAVFGEAAMFSAQRAGPKRHPAGFNSPIAPQNAQFLLNVLHWLSRTPGMPE